jgi:hypothetical protein
MSRRGGGAAMGCAARSVPRRGNIEQQQVRATTRRRALNVRAASVKIAIP